MAASVQTIVEVVRHRLMVTKRLVPLVQAYGTEAVEDALNHAGEFYQGCEEIGSSDANYMMDCAITYLGEPSIFKR